MRSLLWFGLPIACVGVIAACSSFSGGDNAIIADAGPGGDDDDVTKPDSSTPPCERAGLYIVGGADLAEPDAGLPEVETSKILRLPIFCDGTLGEPVTLTPDHPRSSIWGGAVTLGDHVVSFGGSHDTGGPPLGQVSYVATRTAGGALGPFVQGASYDGFERWRFGVASDGKRVFVAGGRLPAVSDPAMAPAGTITSYVDAGEKSYWAVFTKRLDVFDFEASAVKGSTLGDSYVHGERGALAFAHDRLLAYGYVRDGVVADNALYWASVTDGTLSPWSALPVPYVANQFDGAAVTNGNDIYVFGGQTNNAAWARVDMSTDPPTVFFDPNNPMKDESGQTSFNPGPRAVSGFGNVYFLDSSTPYVRYAALDPTGLVIKRGPSLARRRGFASLFIF